MRQKRSEQNRHKGRAGMGVGWARAQINYVILILVIREASWHVSTTLGRIRRARPNWRDLNRHTQPALTNGQMLNRGTWKNNCSLLWCDCSCVRKKKKNREDYPRQQHFYILPGEDYCIWALLQLCIAWIAMAQIDENAIARWCCFVTVKQARLRFK